ncbi:hypothetical protein LH425_06620 [Laribacter hongkongensis]|uniref:phage tail assembly chaperone n=1 Tax=Laribacter hongkongensis TaxID=168471 RepID=UPI0004007044|nr:putative phage tail assembly chaperone [Laribacter hongkongensis]MCG9064717.1 hypothetical protein [Laribacter hongkongensis]
MDNEKRITLDGITYIMTPANANLAWDVLKRAGRLLNGVEVSKDDAKGGAGKAIGAILSNLGDPAVTEIENLVFGHTNVVPADGKPFRLQDKRAEHFNQYRGHMMPLLMQGASYQFGDFFTGGMAALGQLFPNMTQLVLPPTP